MAHVDGVEGYRITAAAPVWEAAIVVDFRPILDIFDVLETTPSERHISVVCLHKNITVQFPVFLLKLHLDIVLNLVDPELLASLRIPNKHHQGGISFSKIHGSEILEVLALMHGSDPVILEKYRTFQQNCDVADHENVYENRCQSSEDSIVFAAPIIKKQSYMVTEVVSPQNKPLYHS